MQRQKVSVNMAVHEEPVKLGWLQNHSLIRCALKTLAYSDKGQFMRATRRVGEPSGL